MTFRLAKTRGLFSGRVDACADLLPNSLCFRGAEQLVQRHKRPKPSAFPGSLLDRTGLSTAYRTVPYSRILRCFAEITMGWDNPAVVIGAAPGKTYRFDWHSVLESTLYRPSETHAVWCRSHRGVQVLQQAAEVLQIFGHPGRLAPPPEPGGLSGHDPCGALVRRKPPQPSGDGRVDLCAMIRVGRPIATKRTEAGGQAARSAMGWASLAQFSEPAPGRRAERGLHPSGKRRVRHPTPKRERQDRRCNAPKRSPRQFPGPIAVSVALPRGPADQCPV